MLCLDLQSLPTHVSEAEMSCGVFWSLAADYSINTICDLPTTVASKNKTESQNLQHKHKLKTESQNP